MRLARATAVILWVLAACRTAGAIAIETELDPSLLAAALAPAGSGIAVTAASVSAHAGDDGEASIGVYTNRSATYGIGDGIVLSSGDVRAYADGSNDASDVTTVYGPEASAFQKTLGDQITGTNFRYFDVTQLDITFDVAPGLDEIVFEVAFGSEEWPEIVGANFLDGFGLFVNGVNVATVNGMNLTAGHPDMSPVVGTELDGLVAPGGAPRLEFRVAMQPGSTDNTLTLILFDTRDALIDTTAFVSAYTAMPEPGTGALVGLSLAALAGWRRARARAGRAIANRG